MKFRPGTRVEVRRHLKAGARTVVRVYTDIDGGRRLDQPVDGFASWNVSDLMAARHPNRARARAPRRVRAWCLKCDGALVREGGVCGRCGWRWRTNREKK